VDLDDITTQPVSERNGASRHFAGHRTGIDINPDNRLSLMPHALGAVETKTWSRGSSQRKTNEDHFLRADTNFLCKKDFSRTALPVKTRDHLPLNTGGRFSAKARAALRWSSVIAVRAWCTASISSTEANGSVSAANRLRFI